jgi:pimeloyl-ACP methyl ester carboxylesterase
MTCFISDNERYIEVNNFIVRYVDVGKGPSLLMIHGLGGRIENWQYNIKLLSAKFRVVAIDLPFHGKTFSTTDSLDEALILSTVQHFIKAIKLNHFYLLGASFGGLLSLLLYSSYKHLIRGLILVCSVGLGEEYKPPLISRLYNKINSAIQKNKIDDNNIVGINEKQLRIVLAENLFYDRSLIPDFIVDNSEENKSFPKRKEMHNNIRRIMFGLRPNLRNIKCKVLIIWGKNDKIMPYRNGIKAHADLENSSFILLEKCGHLPFIEKTDLFNKLLLDYLLEN